MSQMTPSTTRALAWSEVDMAPEVPGVYAWYSRLEIGKADVLQVISRIREAKKISEAKARDEVQAALDRYIFNSYRETPYKVQLRGQLKPKFAGDIYHEPSKSDSLVARLVDDPDRFQLIAEILKSAAPGFTAPLYIGMASNLRNRLRQHKNKIVELRDNWKDLNTDEQADAGFANQIVSRGFDPTNLFVHVAEFQLANSEHNDIENILNRINYPIFGRN
jgi:hypothetical protein